MFSSEEKSPCEEDGSAAGGGVSAGENPSMASLSQFILAVRWMSSSIEGLSGISRLYRVTKVCANNNIPARRWRR